MQKLVDRLNGNSLLELSHMKLYFAYGSNLCKEQMKVRCPKSKYLEKYYLDDHKLCFCWNGLSTNPNGVANIIKEQSNNLSNDSGIDREHTTKNKE